jgi:uncharacterized protein YndB with AHSA1/START domain
MEGFKRSVRVEALVDAPPDAVWAVVSDPTRVGEWSHECVEVEWCDGATTAVPGARFRGRNQLGPIGWFRTNEIVAAEAPRRLVWRTVPSAVYRDSTRWTITLEPAGNGTRIVQTYEVLQASKALEWLIMRFVPPHRDRTDALERDLRSLGDVARRAATTSA